MDNKAKSHSNGGWRIKDDDFVSVRPCGTQIVALKKILVVVGNLYNEFYYYSILCYIIFDLEQADLSASQD